MTSTGRLEEEVGFYDQVFSSGGYYGADGKGRDAIYLWAIQQIGTFDRVLDVACGPGRLLELAWEDGIRIVGTDFSQEALRQARERAPEQHTVHCDLYEFPHWGYYKCFILTEILEHLKRDYELLHNIRRGSKLIATVPEFDCKSHVRTFSGPDEIKERYRLLVSIEKIELVMPKIWGFVGEKK